MLKFLVVSFFSTSLSAFAGASDLSSSTSSRQKYKNQDISGRSSTTSSASRIPVGLLFGYQSLKTDDSSGTTLSGYLFGVDSGFIFKETFGVMPLLRAGLNYFSIGNTLKYKPLPGVTQDISTDLSALSFSFDSGIERQFLPKLSANTTLGYQIALYGRVLSTDKTQTYEKKSERKISSLKNARISGEVRYELAPGMSAGVLGLFQVAGDLSVKETPQKKTSGYSLALTGQMSLGK